MVVVGFFFSFVRVHQNCKKSISREVDVDETMTFVIAKFE
jgi:hypothetical protein